MSDSRARILARIREGVATNSALLQQHAAPFPPPHPRAGVVANSAALDNVALFEREVTALFGNVHVCDSVDSALAQVVAILMDAGADRVLTWAESELPVPGVHEVLHAHDMTTVETRVHSTTDRKDILAALEDVRACITGADAAIAESGSIALVSGPGRGRLASLLPPLHIALLPASRIRRSLPEALDLLARTFGPTLFRERSNVVFVSGPSRTADIKLSLTLGVHGPRAVHVVVMP
jgi:L-lactate dehydrogenase complex protein LldG